VLFLDEPTTGLDPESRAAMWDEITALAATDAMTVLLTTHYLDEADRLASRLAVVDRGRVVAEGEPERLKRELGADSLDEVYLHYAGRRYSDATRVTEVAGR
jgi:ABC-2 type transport system ATP-binding protein